jgi:hypothetical protein
MPIKNLRENLAPIKIEQCTLNKVFTLFSRFKPNGVVLDVFKEESHA